MDNRAKKLLFDVVSAGRSITEWCSGRSYGEYEDDRQLRRAVEREFEVIGEALSSRRPASESDGRVGRSRFEACGPGAGGGRLSSVGIPARERTCAEQERLSSILLSSTIHSEGLSAG